MKKEGYHIHWPGDGRPTWTTGPYETAAEAFAEIDAYTGPEKLRLAAYVMKYEMKRTLIKRS